MPEVAVPAVCAIFERVFGPAKDTPVVYCFKGSACRPGKKRKGGALPRRLLALASLSVLPVPRSRMSGGRVLRVVRMRFLHCFLSRHCDVCVLVAHRRQGAWQQQQAAAEHSVMSMATLAITVEGTSPGIPTH